MRNLYLFVVVFLCILYELLFIYGNTRLNTTIFVATNPTAIANKKEWNSSSSLLLEKAKSSNNKKINKEDGKPDLLQKANDDYFHDNADNPKVSLSFSDSKVHWSETEEDPLLALLRLWNKYRQQHSEQALRREEQAFWEQYNQNRSNTTTTDTTTDIIPAAGSTNRKFAIVFYSCPLQAGNRLHHFFNDILWAVITNRTILWKYYDTTACLNFGQGFSTKICHAANTEEDCSSVLTRASWIPSYDDWIANKNMTKNKNRRIFLGISNQTEGNTTSDFPLVHSLSSRSTIYPALLYDRRIQSWIDADKNFTTKADQEPHTIISFAQLLGKAIFFRFQNETIRKELLATQQAQDRARTLVSHNNSNFLFGLVFRETFQFSKALLKQHDDEEEQDGGLQLLQPNHNCTLVSTADSTRTNSSSILQTTNCSSPAKPITIALHSRHPDRDDDGSNISKERICIEEVLSTHVQNHVFASSYYNTMSSSVLSSPLPCKIFVMSDRPSTLSKLNDYFRQPILLRVPQPQPSNTMTDHATKTSTTNRTIPISCQAIVASHDENQDFIRKHNLKIVSSEHGPFSGIGFYQDLLVAIQARDGFIGHPRSSSNLVEELIEYDRQMEALVPEGNPLSKEEDWIIKNSNKQNLQLQSVQHQSMKFVPNRLSPPLPPLPYCRL